MWRWRSISHAFGLSLSAPAQRISMTLVAAWLRRQGDTDEMVVATDSRLSGGIVVESGPKVFVPLRKDCVIAFAGSTFVAYPLMIQLLRYSEDYARAASRALDLCEFAGHAARLCSDILRRVVRQSSPIPAGIHF